MALSLLNPIWVLPRPDVGNTDATPIIVFDTMLVGFSVASGRFDRDAKKIVPRAFNGKGIEHTHSPAKIIDTDRNNKYIKRRGN